MTRADSQLQAELRIRQMEQQRVVEPEAEFPFGPENVPASDGGLLCFKVRPCGCCPWLIYEGLPGEREFFQNCMGEELGEESRLEVEAIRMTRQQIKDLPEFTGW